MGQVTIYLDNEIENKMKHAARANHVSVSKWVANIIKERILTGFKKMIIPYMRLQGLVERIFS